MAALLAARLKKYVERELCLLFDGSTCWSDRSVILSWIKGDPRSWKPFEAGCVQETVKLIDPYQWLSPQNPADKLSRGCDLEKHVEDQLCWSLKTKCDHGAFYRCGKIVRHPEDHRPRQAQQVGAADPDHCLLHLISGEREVSRKCNEPLPRAGWSVSSPRVLARPSLFGDEPVLAAAFPFLSASRFNDGIATTKQQTMSIYFIKQSKAKTDDDITTTAAFSLIQLTFLPPHRTPHRIFMSNSSYGSFRFLPLHFLEEEFL
ncbi:hypothetical protein T4E_11248 [Trichinella pseudospiralis]|uniref:Uncharacterized protein n=1 Tax=Trichinella pseudospiralis TaxID=6337 RepID=A0A0V0YLB3_TRIPS|nr:hypothetical protein T4E_11248 [Trichinella pseudospiralis]